MNKRTISLLQTEASPGVRARGRALRQHPELDATLEKIDSLQVHCAELQGQMKEMRRG